MAVSIDELEKNPDGSVPGIWRVRLRSGMSCGLPGAIFVDGIAEGVLGARLRSLVAAMGHEIAEIVRTDAVEAPLFEETSAEPERPKRGRRKQ